MEQTRGNYYKMMGFGMIAIAAGAVTAVWFPVFWKPYLPASPEREGLHAFVMVIFGLCALLGGMRAALTIQAHFLPLSEMDEEERQRMQKYAPTSRKDIDRLMVWLAVACIVVVLFNYF